MNFIKNFFAKKAEKTPVKVMDFSFDKRFWGNNFTLCHKLDKKGYKWHIAIWYDRFFNVGDFIILGLSETDKRIGGLMKTAEQIIEFIVERKADLLENLKETQAVCGTNNCGYAYDLGAHDELSHLLKEINDEND